LGNLYAEAGRTQESEQAYGKVVELDPQKAYQTYYNLGVLISNRESATPADTRRAADAFRKAVEIKPDYAAAWQQLGYALIAVGDSAGATEALKSYLRVRPNAPDAERVRSMIKTLQK
jgi:Flp pilus assembly protein TadD